MNLVELKLLLPMEPSETDDLWDTFVAESGREDLDHFLSWLYEQRHVGSETFRALHGHGQLSLVTMDELTRDDDDEDDFDSRFDRLGLLGKGAMGEIHVARERDLRRKVALKLLLPALSGDPATVRRFFREIQITAQLDHPNIVPIYALDTDEDGSPVCAMKLIQGQTLRDWLEEVEAQIAAGTLDDDHGLAGRLDVFLKICDAIAYAHSRGILHRDLKPSNVMIGPFGEVYVMDWGIARPLRFDEDEPPAESWAQPSDGAADPQETAATFRTSYGTVVGTPHYMAPEQAMGRTDLDGRTDLYALGLILYELVSLQVANPGETIESALEEAAVGSLAPLRSAEHSKRVPPELEAMVFKATELRPDDRYPSVAEFADDVRRFRRGEAVRAKPDTARQAVARWVGNNREKTVALLALGLVLILGAITWGLVRERAVMAAAETEQAALGHALGRVASRASRIDREFLRYEGLLEGLAGAAVQALDGADPGEVPYFLAEDYADPETAPGDLAMAARYGKPVSTGWPVHVLAPGLSSEDVEPLLRRLSTLRPRFSQLVARSHPDVTAEPSAAQVRERVAEQGTPIVWAYVGLEEGIHTAWPGKGGYPADYDPRQRPWYELSAHQHGPRCGNPYPDSQGQGLLLPCTTALYAADGRFRGVAGMEMTFDWIVQNLLVPDDLPGLQVAYLLDDRGRVVVRSNYREIDGADVGGALELRRFHRIEVLAAISEGRSGYEQVPAADGTSTFVAWQRMAALGWFYAVEADAATVLAAANDDR